jgi:predicted enzyme related to lactoylglutathione lyase
LSDDPKPAAGTPAWHDLTVDDAPQVRDFYCAVIGWRAEPTDMGGYEDYGMIVSETGDCVAGVCHARGTNADLPPQWLTYFVVADLDTSIANCTDHGGAIVDGPRKLMGGRFCVVRDPAGAVCAIWQQG